MVVGEGCSTSPEQHTLLPYPGLSIIHSQGHHQDQIWMEGIGTRETYCYCHQHCLHCPDHSGCPQPPQHCSEGSQNHHPCLLNILVLLALHNLHGSVQQGTRTICIRGIMQCQNKVASEGLCNVPQTLVQSMQILEHSCYKMCQQLSLVDAQYLQYLGGRFEEILRHNRMPLDPCRGTVDKCPHQAAYPDNTTTHWETITKKLTA